MKDQQARDDAANAVTVISKLETRVKQLESDNASLLKEIASVKPLKSDIDKNLLNFSQRLRAVEETFIKTCTKCGQEVNPLEVKKAAIAS